MESEGSAYDTSCVEALAEACSPVSWRAEGILEDDRAWLRDQLRSLAQDDLSRLASLGFTLVATPDLTALREERDRLLGFLYRAFVQLNEMAGEGLSFVGKEDPADILFDYARAVGMPNEDMETIMSKLEARAAIKEKPDAN